MEPGGIVVGIVGFRMPDGSTLSVLNHHPNGWIEPVLCTRCEDTRRVGKRQCKACRPAPPVVP